MAFLYAAMALASVSFFLLITYPSDLHHEPSCPVGYQQIVQIIQFFLQRLSHNSAKANTTMPIGVMGSNSLVLLGWGSWCLVRRKENVWIHMFVLLPWLESIKCRTIVTHNNFGQGCVHFYAFVRQFFSKQLYVPIKLEYSL